MTTTKTTTTTFNTLAIKQLRVKTKWNQHFTCLVDEHCFFAVVFSLSYEPNNH